MSTNPINLGVRFVLEMASLFILGSWGWQQAEGFLRYVLAIGIPMFAASLWGVFAVPHDPSRSGRAPVPTPGFLRLLLEIAFFGSAIWALSTLVSNLSPLILGGIILLHYGLSYDRILWLLKQTPGAEDHSS